ncbi:WD40-repeat-containing domain protein [Gorgonomyces haynaldii]|nr:WD40-repeat-containing domain protein [Gorgonomyces haynaldii]
MTEYKKTLIKQFPAPAIEKNDFWTQFKSPVVIREFAQVNSIDFAPNSQELAIACSTRVQIYSSVTHQVKKTISRFKDTVLSVKYRNDQKVMVAGDSQGLVQLFDLNSRAILRTLSGHQGGVRCVDFSGQHILSGSDDATVKIWDIAAEEAICDLKEHTDHVRSVVVDAMNPHLLLSGSYDHTVKLWDTRNNVCQMTLDHGAPVEKVLFFKGGSLAISCGLDRIKVWDMLKQGKLIYSLSHHQKTITDMRFDAENGYLITGSLDQQVKMIDLTSYKVVHSIKYPAPILSLAISPNNTHLAVGMTSGMLALRKRQVKTQELLKSKIRPRGNTPQYYNRGADAETDADAVEIEATRRKRLQKYDVLLKGFQYGNALDATLEQPVNPVVVASMIEELINRDGVRQALAGRDEKTLVPILQFVLKYISHPRYASMLIDFMAIILDIYAHILNHSIESHELINKIKMKVGQEQRLLQEYNQVLGQLDLIFAVSSQQSAIKA